MENYNLMNWTNPNLIDYIIVGDAGKCYSFAGRNLRSMTAEMDSDISLEQGVFVSIILRDKKHFENNIDFLPFYQNIVREGGGSYVRCLN